MIDLIPKDKFDFEAVEKLEKSSPTVIQSLLPKLFEWIFDPNWPIAPRLGRLIANQGEVIIPFCKHYINNPHQNDEYCVYFVLLPLLDKKSLKLLKSDLDRVASNPTEYEKLEELDQIARRYLSEL